MNYYVIVMQFKLYFGCPVKLIIPVHHQIVLDLKAITIHSFIIWVVVMFKTVLNLVKFNRLITSKLEQKTQEKNANGFHKDILIWFLIYLIRAIICNQKKKLAICNKISQIN